MALVSKSERKVLTDKTVEVCGFFSCVLFMLMHIVYCIFFFVTGIYPLAYINIASIITYISIIHLVFAKKYFIYATITYWEVIIYYACMFIFLGWNIGTQLILVGFCVIIYLVGYLTKRMNNKNFHPIIKSCLSGFLCVFFAVYTYILDPIYVIPGNTELFERIFVIIHAVIVFSLVILFLEMIIRHALHQDNILYRSSVTDPLTGLNNRLGLKTLLQSYSKEDLSNYVAAIFDIDNFKKFNDVHGHACGDFVLQELARFVSKEMNGGFVCRWGGEEFVILKEYHNDKKDVYTRLDTMREKLSKHEFIYENKKLTVTITIGAKCYNNFDSIESWIDSCDYNLYKGKNSGKNVLIAD